MANDPREQAADIFRSVLKAVDPYALVSGRMAEVLSDCRREAYRRVLLVSFGKAAYPMAKAVSGLAGQILTEGIVITKYGHAHGAALPESIRLFEAGHPLPDQNGVRATSEIINLLTKHSDGKTLLLCLISGGGSALLVAPFGNITLAEKQQLTDILLKAGATIQDLNIVRKHISRVKGGRLAELAQPAKIVSLILSDVIGDPLDIIASGPTSPDPSTFRDALSVIDQYQVRDRIPAPVLDVLLKGDRGEIPETPKPTAPVFTQVENRIIGSNRQAVEVAGSRAKELGYEVTVLSSKLQGEARDVGASLAAAAEGIRLSPDAPPHKKVCLIAGGETTVTVRGNGRGGRNTELSLAFAQKIKGVQGITFLSAGTDGTDGPTDAAGAVVDGGTIPRAEAMNLDPQAFLDNNDSYSFFKKTGELLITGPTGTNVMDIQIALIG